MPARSWWNVSRVIDFAFNSNPSITEQKPAFCIIYRPVLAFGRLCVNWEADVQTTRQTALVDSELCFGLRVSLMTASWHPAPTNKSTPPISLSDCMYCSPAECVCVWSVGLLERHGWKTLNLLNLWCVSSLDDVLQFSTWNDLDADEQWLWYISLNLHNYCHSVFIKWQLKD